MFMTELDIIFPSTAETQMSARVKLQVAWSAPSGLLMLLHCMIRVLAGSSTCTDVTWVTSQFHLHHRHLCHYRWKQQQQREFTFFHFQPPSLVLTFATRTRTCNTTSWSDKKLSYRRGTARCVLSVEILPTARQQCRNYLYGKSWAKYQLSLIDPCDKIVL